MGARTYEEVATFSVAAALARAARHTAGEASLPPALVSTPGLRRLPGQAWPPAARGRRGPGQRGTFPSHKSASSPMGALTPRVTIIRFSNVTAPAVLRE